MATEATANLLSWDDFMNVEMRVGTILNARVFAEARKPAYKLEVDFGPSGIRHSSAQLTKRYKPEQLIGRQVVGVLNFPKKQIGPFWSECLILGAVEGDDVILLQPDRPIPNGLRIG